MKSPPSSATAAGRLTRSGIADHPRLARMCARQARKCAAVDDRLRPGRNCRTGAGRRRQRLPAVAPRAAALLCRARPPVEQSGASSPAVKRRITPGPLPNNAGLTAGYPRVHHLVRERRPRSTELLLVAETYPSFPIMPTPIRGHSGYAAARGSNLAGTPQSCARYPHGHQQAAAPAGRDGTPGALAPRLSLRAGRSRSRGRGTDELSCPGSAGRDAQVGHRPADDLLKRRRGHRPAEDRSMWLVDDNESE